MAEVLNEDYMSSEESENEADDDGRNVFHGFRVKSLKWESKRLTSRKEKLDSIYDQFFSRRLRRQPRIRSKRFLSDRPCPKDCPNWANKDN